MNYKIVETLFKLIISGIVKFIPDSQWWRPLFNIYKLSEIIIHSSSYIIIILMLFLGKKKY